MKVIIAGGGFAGLTLARKLSNKKGVEVLLFDKNNYHQFQPLLYQVATAGLDASNVSFPLRKVFQKSRNVRFRMAVIEKVLPAEKKVVTGDGIFEYDILVIATGATTNFFGNTSIMQHAFPMKSTTEALQLRHRIIENFEAALSADNEAALKQHLTLVIVGGGPTGVEISGALAEMRKTVLPKDYPELDFSKMEIHLVEGGSKTLGSMSEKSSVQSRDYLETLGVKVWTDTVVKDYDGNMVTLSNGSLLPSAIVIWSAGIKAEVPGGMDGTLMPKSNRIIVDDQNRIKGFSDIYALGDVAAMETSVYPHGHPQLATVAIQQAANLAKNLLRQLDGNRHNQLAFAYRDKGSMATVGRHLAVVDLPKPKLHFGGFTAWLIWMGLHLLLILGIKNKIQVFINWMYKYFTYDQSLRLLFRNTYRPISSENKNPQNEPASR